MELDHVFVCANVDAPEAAALEALGLLPGRSATHPGQGTANRCFVFGNAYLELIWVHDPVEASSDLTAPTRLFDRWLGRTGAACPFGFCFRSPPLEGWDYRPRYLPEGKRIRIGANSDRLDEPMLFLLDFATRPDTWGRPEILSHPAGLREITRMTWTRPGDASLTPTMRAVVEGGGLIVESGAAHALTLEFDGGAAGGSASLAPGLPLVLKW